ncbi:MAG: tetratricopeptide repeat protein, partial [Acidobacteria bacterium]|nr:tetratricopeptide repeat protein [Acidobacteriota bacterium]
MKRLLLSILMILTLAAAGVSAQDKAARRAFEKGLAAAGRENFAAALGDFERALTLAEPAAAGDDFRAAIYFNIGVCRYRLKDSARAVREFETAIELKKGVYEKAFYALGMADAELGDWPAAERA